MLKRIRSRDYRSPSSLLYFPLCHLLFFRFLFLFNSHGHYFFCCAFPSPHFRTPARTQLDNLQLQLQSANDTAAELRKANARLQAERGRSTAAASSDDVALRADYEHLRAQLSSMQHLEQSSKKLQRELHEVCVHFA